MKSYLHSVINFPDTSQRQLTERQSNNLQTEGQEILQVPNSSSLDQPNVLDDRTSLPSYEDYQDKSMKLSNPIKSFMSSKNYSSVIQNSLPRTDYFFKCNGSNKTSISFEEELLDFLPKIPQGMISEKVKTSLESKPFNMKEEDIRRIIGMLTAIDQFDRSEIDLQNTFIKIGDLAGGKDKISFNDSDGNCIRNKYGYINRNKEGNVNLKGIYFEKLYQMKIILEKISSQTDSLTSCMDDLMSKSEGLQKDLFNIRLKLKQILAKENRFLPIEYKGLFHEFKDTDEECKMENIKEFANFHYYPFVLNRIKLESSDIEEFDFRNKEDRYYIARKLTIIGEFSREYAEDNKTLYHQEVRNVFLNLKRLRNLLVHCHDRISFGMKNEEEIDSLNENVTILFLKLTEIIEGNKLREDYDYEGLNSVVLTTKNILSKSECEKKSLANDNIRERDEYSTISPETTEIEKIIDKAFVTFLEYPKNLRKVLDKINNEYQEKRKEMQLNDDVEYPEAINLENKDVIMNYYINKSRNVLKDEMEDVNNEGLLSSADKKTKDTKEVNKIRGDLISSIKQAHKMMKDERSIMHELLSKLDDKYQSQLTMIDANDRYKYPDCLNEENESRINEFVNSLSASRDLTVNAKTIKNEKENALMTQRKMNTKIRDLIKETEYLKECKNRSDIKMEKKSLIIDHIVSIIGQIMRDISDLDSTLKGLTTSTIHDYASRSAKVARNTGLCHNLFSLNKDWLDQEIEDNILPAYEDFKSILTVCNSIKGETDLINLFDTAFAAFYLDLYDEVERNIVKAIAFIEENPYETYLINNEMFNMFTEAGMIDIFNVIKGKNVILYYSRLFLMHTYMKAGKYNTAYREILILISKIKLKKAMKLLDDNVKFVVHTLCDNLVHYLFIQGGSKEVIYLMNKFITLSNYQGFKVHLGTAYILEHKHEEAYKVFKENLTFDLEPTKKYILLIKYVIVLISNLKNIESLKKASKHIREIETLFNNNIQMFKKTFKDRFLLMQYRTAWLKIDIIIKRSSFFDNSEEVFKAMLDELENCVQQFNSMVSDMKNDLKDNMILFFIRLSFSSAYSSLINGDLSDLDKEKMKIEKARYFFDEVRCKFDHLSKCERMNSSITKGLIKTACYLATGYYKLAAREDLDEESRNEYRREAGYFEAMDNYYMAKYESTHINSQKKILYNKNIYLFNKNNQIIESRIMSQYLSSNISTNCKSAILTIDKRGIEKEELIDYCFYQLKIEEDDIEIDNTICWISVGKESLDILGKKFEHGHWPLY